MNRRRFLKSLTAAAFGVPLLIKSADAGFGLAYNFPLPVPASALGYTRLVFGTDFNTINSVDVNNTKAPGFKFYLGQGWPHSKDAGWASDFLVDGTLFSANDSILTAATDGAKGSLTGLGFLVSAVQNGTGYTGTMFDPSGGFYIEASMAFDVSTLPTSGSWPAFWLEPTGLFLGQTDEYLELDLFEAFPTGTPGVVNPICGLHDKFFSSGIDNHLDGTAGMSNIGTPNYAIMHRYGTRLTPMAANGGTGKIERFFDGTHIAGADITYSAAGGASPALTPNNPAGSLTIGETQPYAVVIGAGGTAAGSWNVQVDRVGVWTP